MTRRLISWLLAGAFAASTLSIIPGAALASERGRKNTALILGGAAAYSLLKKKPTQGLVLGAGAAYAYKRYRDAKTKRRARQAYASGYRAASYSHSRTAAYRSSYRTRHRRHHRYR